MLNEWIERQSAEEGRLDAAEALAALWKIVSSASDKEIPMLLSEITEVRFGSFVTTPVHDHDSMALLVRIFDRLAPDKNQCEVLAVRFPLSWSMSVMDGEKFEPRLLLNGFVLVRNMHRVLGPAMWNGVTLDMDPDLRETLVVDLKTLRGRNANDNPTFFLLLHDLDGARLLGSKELIDITMPGWGQLIAVGALQQEDLEEGSQIKTSALRWIGRKAQSLIVFFRFFGDRVDLIPASQYDDGLDVFLEKLATSVLGSNIEEGMELPVPLSGELLTQEIIERIGNEADHVAGEGPGASWLRMYAVPALANRFTWTMDFSFVNFGLGTDPDGPRRAVQLPAGVERVIATDPDQKRRSVTLQVYTSSEAACEMVVDGLILDRISEAFEEVGAFGVDLAITGRVDNYLIVDADTLPLIGIDELATAFTSAREIIKKQAEEEAEEEAEDFEDAVVLLIDFPGERPSDRTIAAMARALSGALENTVELYLNGRGEYLVYGCGDTDSGDHELFQLDQDASADPDEMDTDE